MAIKGSKDVDFSLFFKTNKTLILGVRAQDPKRVSKET